MHYDKRDPKTYNNAMGRYKTRKQLEFIRRCLPRKGLRLLDLGGGNGRLAVPLADSGHQVTVLDESKLAIDLLRQEGHPRVGCIHSDILSLENSRAFDAAYLVDALKYMTHASMGEIFSKVEGALADNGVFVLIEMNTGSWRYCANRILGRVCEYNIGTHHAYLTALRQSGFEWLETQGSHWMPTTFNSDSSLVNVFALIERGLSLDRWADQSPWVMVAGRKISGRP